jgi:Leucine-rich repeat (LRR) protein
VYERLVQPNVGEDVPHNAIQHHVLCFGEFRVHSIWGGNSGLRRRGGRRRVWRMQKTILMIVAVALAGCGTTSWVSDPSNPNNVKIEKAIRIATKKPTGELAKVDLEKVTRLSLRDNQLTDVKGLEKLTQLTELYLTDNQLTDVTGLEKLNQLMFLHLHNNKLTDVKGLENLTKLQRLYLQNNQITDISALKELKQLEKLHLADNQISDVSALSELTKLSYLDLQNTKISDVSSFRKLKGLNNLDLKGNQISDVDPLKQLTKLTELELNDNPALTKAQIDELKKALPKCDIRSNPKK